MLKTINLIFLLTFFWPLLSQAVDLEINLSHEIRDGRAFIKGTTNLPDNITIHFKVFNDGFSYQDFFGKLVKNGRFESMAFPERGTLPSGEYTARVTIYKDRESLSERLLKDIDTYTGYNIENGHVAFLYKFNTNSSKPISIVDAHKDALFSLTVEAEPTDSTVKIMNIGPKYKHGIKLTLGKYDVVVQRKGYEKWRKLVTVTKDKVVKVKLKPASKKKPVASKPKYSCGKKYCKNMSSCEEAYYKLNTCGHKRLDRDGDGIPCENICN